ncbi:MAG: ribbon-helix-helix domain-containing protein [Propionibacteriaceae bacterium]|jgi:predicted transcriptional regulator|nr:ribbon-helix-helix domain-containing protein [Propionibacteriaceae bacterium]
MTTYGTTSDGRPITEADVQAWADEAERGYDIGQLKRRGRPRLGPEISLVLPVRITADLDAALSDRAAETDQSRSEVAREALRAYLLPA